MEKPFYVFSVWDDSDGDRHKAASDYSTIDEARKAYHVMLANHVNSDGTNYVMVVALNEFGETIIKPEFWHRPAVKETEDAE